MQAAHTVCIPVLRRYDRLQELLQSLEQSTDRPLIAIIDNGRSYTDLKSALAGIKLGLWVIHTPAQPLGIAESWNWFLRNVPPDPIITNDDVVFAPTSVADMYAADGLFVSALAGTNAFSCFLARQECVARVGYFDEAISPGYGYFEDCDYHARMQAEGIDITAVSCGVRHYGSQTLDSLPMHEMNDHHRKFKIAQANYKAKWGGMPPGAVEQV